MVQICTFGVSLSNQHFLLPCDPTSQPKSSTVQNEFPRIGELDGGSSVWDGELHPNCAHLAICAEHLLPDWIDKKSPITVSYNSPAINLPFVMVRTVILEMLFNWQVFLIFKTCGKFGFRSFIFENRNNKSLRSKELVFIFDSQFCAQMLCIDTF